MKIIETLNETLMGSGSAVIATTNIAKKQNSEQNEPTKPQALAVKNVFDGPTTPRSCGPALSIKSDEGEVVSDGKVYCSSHPEKTIEYFCRVCHCLVCPRCMY